MSLKKNIIIITIMIATAALTSFASKSERIEANKPFSEFPLQIKDWQGSTSEMDETVYNILGVEDYIIANYRNSSNKTANLYVGFYQSQKEGDIIHSPKNCMPGAGWKIISTATETVEIKSTGEDIKAIKLILEKAAQKRVVLYWFQSRGRIISSEYMQKIWLVVDSVIKHRTDGSFVRLIAPVKTNEADAVKVLKEFGSDIYPILNEFIPS